VHYAPPAGQTFSERTICVTEAQTTLRAILLWVALGAAGWGVTVIGVLTAIRLVR
jgi:hypothetical protein